MESYGWGLYVAGAVFFFGGLIKMAAHLSKKPFIEWLFSIIVGIVLAVVAVILIFNQ